MRKLTNFFDQFAYFIFCLFLVCPDLMASVSQVWTSAGDFPANLDEFEFIEYRTGAGGGVCIIERPTPEGPQRFALKGAVNSEYIKTEALANLLYAKAGVRVPKIALYDSIGRLAANEGLREKFPADAKLFMLAEYIDGEALGSVTDKAPYLAQLRPHTIVDMFLSNWDLHGDNIRVNRGGEAVRVDNGGGLDAHAGGGWKGPESDWDACSVSELRTMMKNRQDFYSDISSDEIIAQIPNLLQHKSELLLTVLQFCKTMQIERVDSLYNMIAKRLESLEIVNSGSSVNIADRDAPIGLTGAGVLFHNDGKVLLGKRRGHETWCTPGGKSDTQHDKYLYDTAARETREETYDKFKVSAEKLADSPSHTLLVNGLPNEDEKAINYRLYVAQHQFVDPQELLLAAQSSEDNELTDFRWVKVEDLLRNQGNHQITLEDGTIIELYPQLFKMLNQLPVVDMLKNIAAKRRILIRHSQGIENPNPEINNSPILDLKVRWDAPPQAHYVARAELWGREIGTRMLSIGGRYLPPEVQFANPRIERLQFAKAIAARGQMLAEVKEKAPENKIRFGIIED